MINEMTIQAVAQETRLSTYTLRWYEKIGLIPRIDRAPNGHRRYTADDIGRIRFITRLRDTGMPIEEIKRYVDLPQDDSAIQERLDLLQRQREAIQNKIAELAETLDYIDYKIDHYQEQHEAYLASQAVLTPADD